MFQLKPRPGSGQSTSVLSFERVRPHKQGLIILPKEWRTRNQSELWKGADFSIDRSILVTEGDETPYLVEFEGFAVEDLRLGEVGRVVGFQDNGAQDLLVVRTPEQTDVLIPFVEAFTKKTDKTRKKLVMDLAFQPVGSKAASPCDPYVMIDDVVVAEFFHIAAQVVTMCQTETMTGQTVIIDAGRVFT